MVGRDFSFRDWSASLGAAHVAQLSGRPEEPERAGERSDAPALEVERASADTPAALRAELSA